MTTYRNETVNGILNELSDVPLVYNLGLVKRFDYELWIGVIVNEDEYTHKKHYLIAVRKVGDDKIGVVSDDIIIDYDFIYGYNRAPKMYLSCLSCDGNFEVNEVNRLLSIAEDGDKNSSYTVLNYRDLLCFALYHFQENIIDIINIEKENM